MITSINIKVGRKVFNIILEDAKQIYNDLHELFGNSKGVDVDPLGPHPREWHPKTYEITCQNLNEGSVK